MSVRTCLLYIRRLKRADQAPPWKYKYNGGYSKSPIDLLLMLPPKCKNFPAELVKLRNNPVLK